MNTCRVCGDSTDGYGDHLCQKCREFESRAERFIQSRPRQALEFFRDLVILAGRTLRANTDRV